MKMHWPVTVSPSRRFPLRTGFVFLAALSILCHGARAASASCPPDLPPPSRAAVTEASKDRAFILFNTGNTLLEKKDYEGALALFLQSRALAPRPSNTKNAAICLLELSRFPEALALYEEILARFPDDLDAIERKAIEDKVLELKSKIAIVRVDEREGSFSIDENDCGSLPRAKPVYVMPGSHILRISRAGSAEFITQFSGKAGESILLQIPPTPPIIDAPASGAWFAQVSAGPVFGLSGMTFDDDVPLESVTGVFAEARGGYRLANGFSIALASGVLFTERFFDDPIIPMTFGNVKKFDATYEIAHHIQTFAPFMGASLGVESQPVNHWNLSAHTGFGILGAQSRESVDVTIKRSTFQGDIEQTTYVRVEGRDSTAHSVPFYAALDVGFARRLGAFRIGISIESIFFFVHSPPFPRGRVIAEGVCKNDEVDIACVPARTLPTSYAHRPTFLIIPQLTIGFMP